MSAFKQNSEAPLWKSSFVISLDFELYWGVKDHVRIDDYRENLLGVRHAIPGMLSLFRQYDVHATWATVGMLFSETREQLIENSPALRPSYRNRTLSNYELMSDVGRDEESDPYHFAGSLIRVIRDTPGQELATHTFSHYYCLEAGQTVETFRADLQAAIQAAGRFGVQIRSIVFPRNQFRREYLETCVEAGLKAYRGNPRHWLYQPAVSAREKRAFLKRGLRLADNYVNISGTHVQIEKEDSAGIVNVPASRFLRPFSQRFRRFEAMRLRRIHSDLEATAQRGGLYHLWWHPHNFGANTAENLAFLERVLERFARLRETHGMQSLSMAEYAEPKASSAMPAAELLS
jgi:peptidoglycan/xylan/chitin deacetylase (PgdA/CDA1 family)